MALPTIKLDHPEIWGLVSFPPRRPQNVTREQDRFIYHSAEDLHKLLVAFHGADWMAFKKLGQLSVDAALFCAAQMGRTLLNAVPWGFFWQPISVQSEDTVVAEFYIEPTTEAQFVGFNFDYKINYIMTCHAFNSQFVLRLRNEVLVLGGKTTRGYPLGRPHNKGS